MAECKPDCPAYEPGMECPKLCDEARERYSPTVERVLRQFESALVRKRAYDPRRDH